MIYIVFKGNFVGKKEITIFKKALNHFKAESSFLNIRIWNSYFIFSYQILRLRVSRMKIYISIKVSRIGNIQIY